MMTLLIIALSVASAQINGFNYTWSKSHLYCISVARN